MFQPREESAEEKILASGGKWPSFPDHPEKKGSWYLLKVPGRWDARGAFYMYDFSRKKVDKIGGRTRSAYSQGWIRRTFFVPETWKDKEISLEFSGINRDARLFLNGRRVCDFSLSTKVMISPWLVYGKKNDLSLFVSLKSLPLSPEHSRYKEYCGFRRGDGADWWFNWNPGPGISGNVFLNVRPRNVSLDNLRIVTTTNDKKILAAAELTNRTKQTQIFRLDGRISRQSKTLFQLPGVTVKLAPGSTRSISLSGIWKDAVFWSPEHPNLFRFHLYLRDSQGIPQDELSTRFGFRDIKIQGSDFLLNGKKIHLKFLSSQLRIAEKTDEEIRKILQELKRLHFNGLLYESLDERVLNLCDELGLMVSLRHVFPPLVRGGDYLPGVPNQGIPFAAYLSTKYADARTELESTISEVVRKFRNHPSLVIWMLNPLLCWNPDWINPNRIDEETRQSDVVLASLREEAFLRREDPTRIVIQSMGSNTGAVISCNPYPTFSNQPDEWADWPMRWAEHRKKPLLLEEVALPFVFNFASFHSSSKKRFNSWTEMRQLFYEHAARYFGDPIYSSADASMSDLAWHTLSNGIQKKPDGSSFYPLNPAAEAAHAYWLRRCGLAWRLYDISGIWPFQSHQLYYSNGKGAKRDYAYKDITTPGIKNDYGIPETFTHVNRIFAEQKRIQQPFLAWIAGRPERFTSLEHNYYSGEELIKQLIFSNHHENPVKIHAEYRITEGDRILFSSQWSGEIQSGENFRLPFRWRLPTFSKRNRLSLELTARSGGETSRDTFQFTVFPREKTISTSDVTLYDEYGTTERLLQKMEIPYRKFTTSSAMAGTLVVGNNSFTEQFLSRIPDLKQKLQAGLTLLVMNQNKDTVLGPYLEERRARHVFLKDPQHPILQGIQPEDLLHWRGESDVAEAYPESRTAVHRDRFMHWGQEGTVSSYVLDKPYSGRFRILLDCDADLSRTVLMEYLLGKGRLIFCQLDLDSRFGKDPVATRLTERLLAYAAKPEQTVRKKVVFIGQEMLKGTLEGLGFRFQKIPWKKADVLISADSTLAPEELNRFVSGGGTLLFLGNSNRQYCAFGIPVPESTLCRLAAYDPSPYLRGIGNSDFYLNPAMSPALFPGRYAFLCKKTGKGTVSAFSLLPEQFQEYASRIKIKRVLSVLLTNLGAEGVDEISFHTDKESGMLTGRKVAFLTDPEEQGLRKGYHLPEFPDSTWKHIKLGFDWEGQGINMNNPRYKNASAPYDGDAWYRVRVFIPGSWKGKPIVFHADSIDDLDWVWLNGIPVGHTGMENPEYWAVPRNYRISEKAIRFGKENLLAIRVRDLRGNGGVLNAVYLAPEGAPPAKDALWERPRREIRDFDPNFWRQW